MSHCCGNHVKLQKEMHNNLEKKLQKSFIGGFLPNIRSRGSGNGRPVKAALKETLIKSSSF